MNFQDTTIKDTVQKILSENSIIDTEAYVRNMIESSITLKDVCRLLFWQTALHLIEAEITKADTTFKAAQQTHLKQYESCLGCRFYVLSDDKRSADCIGQFPLQLLQTAIHRAYNGRTVICLHKPKHGCIQKQYNSAVRINTSQMTDVVNLLFKSK